MKSAHTSLCVLTGSTVPADKTARVGVVPYAISARVPLGRTSGTHLESAARTTPPTSLEKLEAKKENL